MQIRPFLLVFAVSGVTLMLGIWVVLWHAFRLTGEIILSPAPSGPALEAAEPEIAPVDVVLPCLSNSLPDS